MKDARAQLESEILKWGLDPKLAPAKTLRQWLARARHPLLDSGDDLVNLFIDSMMTGEPASFIYAAGSHPGSRRRIKVSLVFQHEPGGRIYVSGYCLDRAEHRTFSLDLIMVIHAWN